MSAPMCPRCEGYIPSNLTPGRYPGAISRVDNKTEVCSDCGREEAMSIHALESLWPVSALPEFPAAANRAFERMLLVEDIR
jgi:ribosomal protein S27AE